MERGSPFCSVNFSSLALLLRGFPDFFEIRFGILNSRPNGPFAHVECAVNRPVNKGAGLVQDRRDPGNTRNPMSAPLVNYRVGVLGCVELTDYFTVVKFSGFDQRLAFLLLLDISGLGFQPATNLFHFSSDRHIAKNLSIFIGM